MSRPPDRRQIRGACALDCPDTCSWLVTVDPLALVSPANHYFLNSTFANVAHQQHRAGPATLMIHPEDAAPRGIAAGDEVRVGNARVAFYAIAEVTDRVRPGVVASPKGRWPVDARHGATVNATVDERDSDMGGGAVFHDNRVQVARATVSGTP